MLLCAMTGEISLSGTVQAIGGLREKCLAAERMGIRNILIPKENEYEIPLLPKEIQSSLTFHLVTHIEEALCLCFPSAEISGSVPQIFE